MPLPFLQNWFQSRCNGYWEHAYGVTIETLDTPGWLVSIDVVDTPLERKPMTPVRVERSDKDWMVCEVQHGKFRGEGDARKLAEILRVFQDWATQPPQP